MREQSLDLIRGGLILYVVFYHMSLTYGVISFNSGDMPIFYDIMSFFMAPFYFFSGYLFSAKRSPIEFVKNKTNKLLIPYLFFAIVSLIVYYINRFCLFGTIDFKEPFRQFISTAGLGSDTPLWFFFSLYFVSIVYYLVDKYCSKYRLIFILLCFLFSIIVHDKTQILSCGNIALGIVYYFFGNQFHRIISNKKVNDSLLFIIAVLVFVAITLFDRQNFSFVLLQQRNGSFILNLPFSLSACYILYYIGNKVKSLPVINFIGCYSLVLFASHRIILNWIYDPIIMKLLPGISFCIYTILGFIVIISIYLLLLVILKKYAPKLIGL